MLKKLNLNSSMMTYQELLHLQVRRGGREKTPLVQGKEQQLRFAGAAVKRYPTSKVRETQVRCERASEGRHTKTIFTENYSV